MADKFNRSKTTVYMSIVSCSEKYKTRGLLVEIVFNTYTHIHTYVHIHI
jgi:hypothetical protein